METLSHEGGPHLLALEIGQRLRIYRESIQASQEKLATMVAATKRAIQNNEMGLAAPNSRILHQLANLGLNVNWLLNGEGPMLVKDMASADRWDPDLLAFVIETVDAELRKRERTLAIEKFAQMVVLFYEFCRSTGRRDSDMVERFLKIA